MMTASIFKCNYRLLLFNKVNLVSDEFLLKILDSDQLSPHYIGIEAGNFISSSAMLSPE